MTETEKTEKRRAYQRKYYKDYRKGKKALERICNLEQTKKNRAKRLISMQKISCILIIVICLICFSGCSKESKNLYKSESVEIVQEGNILLISDLIADKEYSFRSVRLRRSEGILKPYKSIDTDTINIETMPSGFRIYDKTAKKIIYISNNKFTQ